MTLETIKYTLTDLITKTEKEFGENFIKKQILNYRENKRDGFLERYYRFCKVLKNKRGN